MYSKNKLLIFISLSFKHIAYMLRIRIGNNKHFAYRLLRRKTYFMENLSNSIKTGFSCHHSSYAVNLPSVDVLSGHILQNLRNLPLFIGNKYKRKFVIYTNTVISFQLKIKNKNIANPVTYWLWRKTKVVHRRNYNL